MRQIVAEYGLTAEDLGLAQRHDRRAGVEAPVLAKYRGSKADATWSGRGRAPAWIGKNRDKFLIVRSIGPYPARASAQREWPTYPVGHLRCCAWWSFVYNDGMTPCLPKYLELADHTRFDILHGVLPAGSIAPSGNGTTQRYGVSRLATRRTLNELTAYGLFKYSRGQRSVALDRVGLHRPVLYAPGQSDAALEYVLGTVHMASAFWLETTGNTVAAALDPSVGA